MEKENKIKNILWKIRENRQNLILFCVVMIAMFLFLEVIFRIALSGGLMLDCELLPTNANVMPDYNLGWVSSKSMNTCIYTGKRIVHFTTNGQGLRAEKDYSFDKTKKRVLLLGDSFIQSVGTDDSETMAVKLQQYLGEGYEVINAGVSGYGTDQEYYWLLTEGLKYKPDIVLVNFFLNDYSDNSLTGQSKLMFTFPSFNTEIITALANFNFSYYREIFDDFPLIARNHENLVNLTYAKPELPFYKKSVLLLYLDEKFNNIKTHLLGQTKKTPFIEVSRVAIYYLLRTDFYDGTKTGDQAVVERGSVAFTYKLFYEIEKLGQQNNFKTVFVYIPFRFQHDPQYRQTIIAAYQGMELLQFDLELINTLQEVFMREMKYNYVDLLPLLKKYPPEQIYFSGDFHWNEKGSDVVAKELAAYIESLKNKP